MQALLNQSIKEYKLILGKTNEIEDLLIKLDSEAITSQASTLDSLLSNSQKTDTIINNELGRHPDVQNHPLFIQRSDIIKQIFEKNKEIAPKVLGILAVYKTEFKKIRTGMKSISGYSQEKNLTGKLVSNKF